MVKGTKNGGKVSKNGGGKGKEGQKNLEKEGSNEHGDLMGEGERAKRIGNCAVCKRRSLSGQTSKM